MRVGFRISLNILLLAAVLVAEVREPATSCVVSTKGALRVFPAVDVGCGHRLTYLGTYFADGKYRADSRFSMLHESATAESEPSLRPAEVPEFVDLHPRERTVEDISPGKHTIRHAQGHSLLAEVRDDAVTFAYGRERAFLGPRYVTTDSTGRAIVSDPAAEAVHVLDRASPYRILAGNKHRLQSVGAVAVDKNNNIFVADPRAGVVVVFDANGEFFREIGKVGEDEGLFHNIEGIAIDRRRQRLYVADGSRDMLLVLNIEGKILQRVGGRRSESGVTLDHPTAVVVKSDKVVVLDAGGSRMRVFDLRWKLLLTIATNLAPGYATEMGLDVDMEGNIYLSNMDRTTVRIYDLLGNLQTTFGSPGARRGEFSAPAALWIDAENKLYVAEKGNRRVQVFQISEPAKR